MATLNNLTVNSTGYLTLPNGTTAQRPGTPTTGMYRYNTSMNGTEFWNGTKWVTIGILDGSNSGQAAASAVAIKTLTGTTVDGFYWINVNGTPTQVWCDMNNDGGGWMMIARLNSDNSAWNYYDAIWTDTTTTNAGQPASFGGNIKTTQYYLTSFTQVRLAMGSTANGLVESTWSGSNFASFMGGSVNSSNARSTWTTWLANSGCTISQSGYPNCNQFGTNKAYGYQNAKIGGTLNNENDCTSNDQALGFGLYGTYVYSNRIAAGCGQAAGNYSTNGWIFIK